MSEQLSQSTRPPFVLVHGAFHGGWCWKYVAARLRADGHNVFTPTQTGLGERRHLLSRQVTMETFVLDIVNLVKSEDLNDVILVGHSFGGRTIGGVADRIPEHIRRLIFLDAGLAHDGRSRLETMSSEAREARVAASITFDGGISLPPPPAAYFGISDPDVASWVDRFLTPHPMGTENTGVALSAPLGNGLPATYIHCIQPQHPATAASASYARSRPEWVFEEFHGGHSAIMTHPVEISKLLLREAARPL